MTLKSCITLVLEKITEIGYDSTLKHQKGCHKEKDQDSFSLISKN